MPGGPSDRRETLLLRASSLAGRIGVVAAGRAVRSAVCPVGCGTGYRACRSGVPGGAGESGSACDAGAQVRFRNAVLRASDNPRPTIIAATKMTGD
jgi:hypothetical protein